MAVRSRTSTRPKTKGFVKYNPKTKTGVMAKYSKGPISGRRNVTVGYRAGSKRGHYGATAPKGKTVAKVAVAGAAAYGGYKAHQAYRDRRPKTAKRTPTKGQRRHRIASTAKRGAQAGLGMQVGWAIGTHDARAVHPAALAANTILGAGVGAAYGAVTPRRGLHNAKTGVRSSRPTQAKPGGRVRRKS